MEKEIIEILYTLPVWLDTNLRVTDDEHIIHNNTPLFFFLTKKPALTDKKKTVWICGYAFSGVPENSQLQVQDEDLMVALKKLYTKIMP